MGGVIKVLKDYLTFNLDYSIHISHAFLVLTELFWIPGWPGLECFVVFANQYFKQLRQDFLKINQQ